MGSAYVNDFNMFGRTYRVTAQADGNFRLDPENVARIRVRNADGQMVPLGCLVIFKEVVGAGAGAALQPLPDGRDQWRLGARHIVGAGAGNDDRTSLPERCPRGCRYEWTDLSFQEKRAGRTGYYIFALSVLFVFLALAAQYESWSLPLADHPDRADVPAVGDVRRLAAWPGHQHPHADRLSSC